MKILYSLHQYFPYYYTGTELLTLNIASYIKKFGNTPYILAYRPEVNKAKIELLNFEGIKTYHISNKLEDAKRDIQIQNKGTSKKIETVLNKIKPDILHITHLSRVGDIARLAQKKKIPYIITLTDFWTICPKATLMLTNTKNCTGPEGGRKCSNLCFKKLDYNFISRFKSISQILSKAEYIAYASNDLINIVRESISLDKTKLINIKHGYNISERVERKINKKYFNFAYIGSFNIFKGVHIAIKAFSTIKNNNIRLLIYGNPKDNPSYSKYLKSIAKKDTRIIFKGTYKKVDTAKVYSDIDTLIVPSTWRETYPFVATTALAYRVPVLGSNIGGIPEIIHNNKLLFRPGDVKDLTKKMEYVIININKNQIIQNLQYNQRIESECFEYQKIYESIAQNRRII